MPEVYRFHCTHCDLSFPIGWGGHAYVINSEGVTVICPHPGEISMVQYVLGKDASEELINERTGYNSYSICLDCLNQFALDIKKEKRKCPSCGSHKIKTVLELVDGICPKCKHGRIVKEDTGIIS